MKAMILAAGRGKRMQPFTDTLPKPLLLVGDKPLLAYHLLALAKIGIQEVVINLSHLADRVQQNIGDGSDYNLRIHYSVEQPALETGGGILQALPLLGPDPFLVVSGDIWTDFPFQNLPQQLTDKLAHLVLVDNPSYHPHGDFVLENGYLSAEGPKKLTFANIGIYHPDLFKNCQPGAFPLGKLLRAAIHEGKISGEHYRGDWVNVGTPEEWKNLTTRVQIPNNCK